MVKPIHKEDIKAGLRKQHGSLKAFEIARKLPSGSVRDVLRGRSSVHTEAAISAELQKPLHLLFPLRYPAPQGNESSTNVDDSHFVAGSRRLSAGRA